MPTPDELDQRFTLRTATDRYDALRAQDALVSTPLTREESLELLALGEVIARKAGYGRQLTVRSARRAGASWSQIGAALGTSKQAAWESHTRWIDGQAAHPQRNGHIGWNADDLAAAHALAGEPQTDDAD
jgi:hypothetical protein